jgi:hypothetical protein
MPVLALAFLLILPLVVLALMPLILIQRYRAGRARRLARPWLATVNLVGVSVSAVMFLAGAAVVNFWIDTVLIAAGYGLAAGLAVALVGLWLTRWEATARDLHYTPNRWLVLFITLAVAARLLYGYWRAWTAWQSPAGGETLVEAFGVPGAMSVGGLVLGYYLTYAIGLRLRIGRWQKRPLRVMRG